MANLKRAWGTQFASFDEVARHQRPNSAVARASTIPSASRGLMTSNGFSPRDASISSRGLPAPSRSLPRGLCLWQHGAWRMTSPGNAVVAADVFFVVQLKLGGKMELDLQSPAALREMQLGTVMSPSSSVHTLELEKDRVYFLQTKRDK